MEEETDGIKGEIDGIEGETDGMEKETDGERLTIVEVVYVIETTSVILNTFFSNRTVACVFGNNGKRE